MKIKGFIKRTSLSILFIALCILPFSINSYAYEELFINIPIYVDKSVEAKHYKIIIEENDDDTLEENVNSSTENKIVSIKDGNIELLFKEPGIYSYKIYEKEGENKNIIYDDTVYKLYCYVENSEENRNMLKASFVLDDGSGKKEKLYFENRYIRSGGGGNGKRASIIEPIYSDEDEIEDVKTEIKDKKHNKGKVINEKPPRTYDDSSIYTYLIASMFSLIMIAIYIKKIK